MHRIAPEDRCLTLVIAAYNEADALPALQPRIAAALDAAEREGLQARVLYIDDGSRDATWSILHGLAAKDPRIGLLRLSRNFGKEAALTAGLDRIERGAALILDADGRSSAPLLAGSVPMLPGAFGCPPSAALVNQSSASLASFFSPPRPFM